MGRRAIMVEKTTAEQLETDRELQENVADRRKGSGLELVKLYLDREVVRKLEELTRSLGYENTERKSKKRLETLSQSVSYCILQQLDDDEFPKPKPETRLALEYYRIYLIAEHRRIERNNDNRRIARFMTSNKYPRP
jgi:hypothetical protein